MTVIDNFTDADNTLLTAHNTGFAWGKFTSGQQIIISNALRPNAAGADQWCFDNTNSYNNDGTNSAKVVLNSETTDESNGPGYRMSKVAETGYVLYVNNAGTKGLQMYKSVAGAFTQLGSTGPNIVLNDIIKIEAIGTAIQAYINGVSKIGPITDSSVTSGVAGCYAFGTSTNFAIDDMTATGDISAQTLTGTAIASGEVIGTAILLRGLTLTAVQDVLNIDLAWS